MAVAAASEPGAPNVVRDASLAVENSTLEGNQAQGGNGGSGGGQGAGGGGGGLGGDGGRAHGPVEDRFTSGAGGGGGAQGDGGSSLVTARTASSAAATPAVAAVAR